MSDVHVLFRLTVAPTNPCRADFDNNGHVDPADVAAFISAWYADLSANPPTTLADFDNDGVTTPADVAAFIAAWLEDITTCNT